MVLLTKDFRKENDNLLWNGNAFKQISHCAEKNHKSLFTSNQIRLNWIGISFFLKMKLLHKKTTIHLTPILRQVHDASFRCLKNTNWNGEIIIHGLFCKCFVKSFWICLPTYKKLMKSSTKAVDKPHQKFVALTLVLNHFFKFLK